MSLDLYIGKENGSFNYTYNVAPIWYVAEPNDKRMIDIDGLTGKQSLAKLKAARDLINKDDKLDDLNPKNGWGSRLTFIIFLDKLIEAAKDHPRSKWRSCR